MHRYRIILIWVCLIAVATVPITAALMSPLLAWRQPVYIVAGVAGIVALVLLLFQPMLATGLLPGLGRLYGRRIHRWVGITLVLLVGTHVAGLWLTSPPDVVDALLFRAPTPFSAWGVIAMWALFISGCMVALRSTLPVKLQTWRQLHRLLAVIIVACSVVHAMLVDGTMEITSKSLLCVLLVLAILMVIKRISMGEGNSASKRD